MSFDDILSGIRRMRANIRISTGRSEGVPRDTLGLMRKNFVAKLQSGQAQNPLQHLQASGNPTNNPTSNMGAQEANPNTIASRIGHFGFFQRPQTPQQPPPPPTEEQKRQMVELQKLKVLEDKQLAVKAKKKRLDHLQGLSVDRT